MNLLIDFYNILHLQNILELLQYNDIFDNGRRIFMALLSVLRKVAPGAGGACLAIGAYFWMFGGETGKQTAKKWWVGTAVAIAVIFGTDAIISWLQANAKF